jgi:hypothetical protein
LRDEVRRAAAAIIDLGVGAGDLAWIRVTLHESHVASASFTGTLS